MADELEFYYRHSHCAANVGCPEQSMQWGPDSPFGRHIASALMLGPRKKPVIQVAVKQHVWENRPEVAGDPRLEQDLKAALASLKADG